VSRDVLVPVDRGIEDNLSYYEILEAMTTAEPKENLDFIRQIVADDLATGKHKRIATRFPPEPNGYLHIGHAKAICINFGIADDFGGTTNLRFDDTNPATEKQEYIDAIKKDIDWLGFEWENERYASDYFDQLYEWAVVLIQNGLAYVDDQSAEQIRETRGTLTERGKPSPCRDRSIEENLELFEQMRAGQFANGEKVLRAKIDMASSNINLRDPVMYRILHAEHPRTGDKWCIYPMYDWAHGQSDWIEGITHSLCDISFENHRPLYEWFLDRLAELDAHPPGVTHKPRQIEFARGNITYMALSKRWLRSLIDRDVVSGWDDPRMPTLLGMRRRGFTPESIRRFWDEAGVAKRINNIEFAKLESILRDDLNRRAERRMAVLDPLKVTITNWPHGEVDWLPAVNNPEDESAGTREVPFSGVLYVERNDFMEDPPRKFFRLGPGREVRLRYGYWITCTDYVKDEAGEVVELKCTYDPQTRGGDSPPDGRKVKGTLHWVSAAHAIEAKCRLYEHLFEADDPTDVAEGGDWISENVNTESLKMVNARVEPSLNDAAVGDPIQFERMGYFVRDAESAGDTPVFNRTVTLRDTWAKIQKQQQQSKKQPAKQQ